MSKLNKSIIKIRAELAKADLKKSGRNEFAGFSYFELGDFLPTLTELMAQEGVNDRFFIDNNYAILELIKDEEKQAYTMPFVMFDVPLSKNGKPQMQQIQYLGALTTYYRRYLYMNAFGISEGEIIDKMEPQQQAKAPAPAREQKRSQKAKLWAEFEKKISEYSMGVTSDGKVFFKDFLQEEVTEARVRQLLSKPAELKRMVEEYVNLEEQRRRG